MSPRPQIDHIRKPQLLAAAAEVIAERGIAATRISDVADRAGTSSPAVLYWFGSKEQLLSEALTWEEDRFYADLTGRLGVGMTPPERLALLIEASSNGGGWLLWMELWSRALRDPGVATARGELDRRWRGVVAEIVEDGKESGEFEDCDADHVAATLAALLDGLAVQVSLKDPEMPPERMVAIARRVAESELGTELPEVKSGEAARAAVA